MAVKKDLINYIKREKSKGFSIEQIKSKLKESGYSKEDIENNIESSSLKPNIPLKQIGTISLIIIALIVLIFFSSKLIDQTKNIDLSADYIDQEEYDRCVYASLESEEFQCMAFVNDDLSLCEKWIELKNRADQRDFCLDKYQLYKEFALNKKDLQESVFVTTEFKNIYRLIKEKDMAICSNLPSYQDTCQCFVKNDITLCRSQNCIVSCGGYIALYNALTAKNANKCIKEASDEPDYCTAMIKSNSSICINQDTKIRCYNQAKMVGKEKKNKIDDELINKAINQKNISFCDGIFSSDIKEKCLNTLKNIENFEYSLSNNDKSYCYKVLNEDMQSGCLTILNNREDRDKLGDANENISYCDTINNLDIKQSCIAIVNNDLDLCRNVMDNQSKFYCIANLGEKRNDKSICNELAGDYIIQCQKYLSFLG